MKRTAAVLLSLIMVIGLLAGCGSKTDNNEGNTQASPSPTSSNEPSASAKPSNEQAGYADGLYYAEGEYAEKSGWKEIVALKVEGGKIVSVNWNGLSRFGGLDKKAVSEAGKYGMVANGGAQAEWHEQASKMEQFLVQQQSTAGIKANEEGITDAVSGVSIGVGEFSSLVNKALEAAPVIGGSYKDGSYYAEAAEFDANSGWKENVQLTVMNGHIVAVRWNGVHKDGGTDKVTRSTAGEYGLVAKGGAQAEWHEQALKAEQYLLEKQDPAAIVFNAEDGKTDAISGVSIHVNSFVELSIQALKDAK
jgi:major membrane immunogen (membrane-anchored lipoprotein)